MGVNSYHLGDKRPKPPVSPPILVSPPIPVRQRSSSTPVRGGYVCPPGLEDYPIEYPIFTDTQEDDCGGDD